MITSAASLVKLHEALRLFPYIDTTGHVTIGWGRNLSAKGLSMKEADLLFTNDLHEALDAARWFPWFAALNAPRQAVILDMLYNLGESRFKRFLRFQAALQRTDYRGAAQEMRHSIWARQVKSRATRLMTIMETGEWPVT